MESTIHRCDWNTLDLVENVANYIIVKILHSGLEYLMK